MKYYLLVGEASGDMHASRLMRSLRSVDPQAEFRFFGGDLMTAEGGTRVRHYKDLAYMGLVPVLMHLPTILRNMAFCKKDIVAWQPDCVIFVDYAGFNLSIAKYLNDYRHHTSTGWRPALYYYISPKIWAWKEGRIKNFKRDIDEMFSILPFEVDFFEGRHNYPIHYVGNPTAHEVREFLEGYDESFDDFSKRLHLDGRKVIALLAGSRRQEIKDNLPMMLDVASEYPDYQFVVAGAPGIEKEYYESFAFGQNVRLVHGETYPLLAHATAALVTSGTATLETACFRTPQVVCYRMALPHLMRWGFNHLIKCKYISLVNLIADREVVRELLADMFTRKNIISELTAILPGGTKRQQMLDDYEEVHRRLGNTIAPDNAARIIYGKLEASPRKPLPRPLP